MAFAIPPTFSEVRQSVAIRANLGSRADSSSAMRDIISENVRKAVAYLYLKIDQAQLNLRVETALVEGQTVYDWPDNFDPGKINTISVLDTDGHEFALVQGISSDDRNQYDGNDNNSLPVRYEILNEELVLLPPPDATTYVTLRIEGYSKVVEPVHNDDRIPFDKEAAVSLATAYVKIQLNRPEGRDELSMALQYIEDRRGSDSEGGQFTFGANEVRSSQYLNNMIRRELGVNDPYRVRNLL